MLHMEQKNYKLEIFNILLKNRDHVRSIAKKLNINHMMIVRNIRVLLDANAIDFISEGKNKKYFIKDSPEARSFFLMTEAYILIKLLGKHSFLRDIVGKIQKDKKIKLALIFGSYAKDLERKNSDIDIFIETNDLKIKQKYSEVDSKFNVKIGKLGKDNLSKEIWKNHVLIKGEKIYYDKIFN